MIRKTPGKPTRKPANKAASKPASKPANKAASKPASKAASKPAKGKPSSPPRRDVMKLISIGITPPELSEVSEARALDLQVRNRDTRPGPIALSKLPWLRQNIAYQAGYHMMTHGLRQHADHPEIEVCNVPGVLVRSVGDILNQIADYILNEGATITPGQTMRMSTDDDPFLSIIGFRRIRPGKGGMDHESDVLRIVFLR